MPVRFGGTKGDGDEACVFYICKIFDTVAKRRERARARQWRERGKRRVENDERVIFRVSILIVA